MTTKPTDWAWRCQECGKVFRSQRAAERAAFGDCGCPRCGSADIDLSQAREVEEAARAARDPSSLPPARS